MTYNTTNDITVLDHIEDVIENSNYVGSGSYVSHGAAKKQNIIRYDYFETSVKINGQDYIVNIDVEVETGKNKYRTHKVINEMSLTPSTSNDLSDPQMKFSRSSGEVGPVPTAQDVASSSFIDNSIPNLIENVNENSGSNRSSESGSLQGRTTYDSRTATNTFRNSNMFLKAEENINSLGESGTTKKGNQVLEQEGEAAAYMWYSIYGSVDADGNGRVTNAEMEETTK